MTRRTRTFVLFSLALLATGLLIGGLLARFGTGGPGALSGAATEDLRALPRTAVVVAQADVRRVMASDLRRRLQAAMGPSAAEGRRSFEAETGIDLERDIDRVTVALLPEAGTGGTAPDGAAPAPGRTQALLLVRGRVDAARVERAMRAHSGRSQMAVLEPTLLAVGDAAAVREAQAVRQSGRSLRDDADVMRRIGEVAAETAWMVARVEGGDRAAWLPRAVGAQLAGVTWMAVGGTMDGGLSGRLVADARDEAAARDLRDMARGLVALGRLQSGSRPELRALLDSVQLGGDGRTLRLAARVPADVLTALAAIRPGEAAPGHDGTPEAPPADHAPGPGRR